MEDAPAGVAPSGSVAQGEAASSSEGAVVQSEAVSSSLADSMAAGVVLSETQLGNMALRAKQQRHKAEQDKQLLQVWITGKPPR
jgi:hypothetical protein